MTTTQTATTQTATTEIVTCVMCNSAANRYRGKYAMCFGCYADSVE